MPIRILQLSKELLFFIALCGLSSVLYLALQTGDRSARGPKPHATPTNIEKDQQIDVSITLVTADATALACSWDNQVGTSHCEFDASGKPWPSPEASSSLANAGATTAKPSLLSPYMTTDNVLFLIPDLWSEPAIARRFEQEPPGKFERDQLRRFYANCKMRLEQKAKNFKVRWQPTATWDDRNEAWVGRISNCSIVEG